MPEVLTLEQWFAHPAYDLVYAHRNEQEARQVVELIERIAHPAPGSHILDVGCGRGRHARAFARRGYRVTAVDLLPEVLAIARKRTQLAGLAVTYLQADMRALPFREAFDGVVNLFTSFGFFETDEEHEQAIGAMARALRPGGWLVQDFLNAPYVRQHLVPEDVRTLNGLTVYQRRFIEEGFLFKHITIRQGHEEMHFEERVRLLEKADFLAMYARQQLHVEACLGDYTGAPHTEESPRLILYARRAS